jgi:hypothetical protein
MPTVRNNLTYQNARKARALDIVEGVTDFYDYKNVPFLGRVLGVQPNGRAEVAFVSRPEHIAARLIQARLQNLAARMLQRELVPLERLKLRSRASRPLAPHLKQGLNLR